MQKKEMLVCVATFVIAGTIGFGVFEAGLREKQGNQKNLQATSNAKQFDYSDVWRKGGMGPGGFLKESFDGQVVDGYGGTVHWVNNAHGFRSKREFSQKPQPEIVRVLSLGDSFVAGYRVEQGRTYSDLVEEWSSAEGVDTEVIIACTENPNQALDYMKKYGVGWNPQIVLLSITLGNDIYQDYVNRYPKEIGFRHGLEVFDIPDYGLVDPSELALTFGESLDAMLRAHSRLYDELFPMTFPVFPFYGRTEKPKLFDVSTGLSMYLRDVPSEIEEAWETHFAVLRELKEFLGKQNMQWVVFLIPQRFQIQPKDWRATMRFFNLNEDAFDLDLPNTRFSEFCEKEAITLIDPTKELRVYHKSLKKDLYLPMGDMHWNEEGHKAASESLRKPLSDLISAQR